MTSTDSTIHTTVLLNETVEQVGAAQGGVFLDCTLGGGGHTEAILNANPINIVHGCDRDPQSLQRAGAKFQAYGPRCLLHKLSFAELAATFPPHDFTGMIADLGLSTDQIKGSRGFSFADDASLDMRMNPEQGISAAEWLNSCDYASLLRALQEGGVGREAAGVTRAIIDSRPFDDAAQLSKVVTDAVRRASRGSDKSIHPATVVFQAIRMFINDERGQMQALLEAAPKLVREGGRFAVITFHSIEDQLIVSAMRRWQNGDTVSSLSRSQRVNHPIGKLLHRKPTVPSAAEVLRNPSARSARLRTFEFSHQVA